MSCDPTILEGHARLKMVSFKPLSDQKCET